MSSSGTSTASTSTAADAPPLDAQTVAGARAEHASSLAAIQSLAAGFPDSDSFLQAAGHHFRMTPVGFDHLRALAPDFQLLPFVEAGKRLCAAFTEHDGGRVFVVVADPLDGRNRAWIEAQLRKLIGTRSVHWGLTSVDALRAWLATMEPTVRAMDSVGMENAATSAGDSRALSISIEDISTTESPVVRLVNSTIYDALRSGASDIHFESHATGMNVKYRVDGVLLMIKRVDGNDTAAQVLSRVKVLSELDIAERRIPQDGRFKVLAQERAIDLRVSIMPNLYGEDAVLRVLDRYHLSGTKQTLQLETLGFTGPAMAFVRRLSVFPYGMLLVTGPTGSGKTTTLYAAISEINTGLDKIITIEDPVEYELPGVLQIPVNEKKGLSFARGLRSILRHDPDKIMVGEIRDAETAQIAVQAALTGHQVFTTVHANNVFDVIGRFNNMGIDPYSFVSALNGILAQRLVRLNCPECVVDDTPDHDLLRASGVSAERAPGFNFRRGRGCAHCRGSGYKGRRAIAETLLMDDRLRDLMGERASLSRIRQAAREAGLVTLREAALDLVAHGYTTLEEINRVTPVE